MEKEVVSLLYSRFGVPPAVWLPAPFFLLELVS